MVIEQMDSAAGARFRAIPFFAGVSDDLLDELRPNVHERTFKAGDRILESTQYCDGAYFLTTGVVELRFPGSDQAGTNDEVSPRRNRAKVQRTGRQTNPAAAPPDSRSASDVTAVLSGGTADARRILLEAGDIFGELSALARYPVGTDVVATSDVSCWLIDATALRKLFDEDAVPSFRSFFDARYRDRTLTSVLGRVGLFAGVDDQSLIRLRAAAELLSFDDQETIAVEGADADALYVVRGGFVRVSSRTAGGEVAVTYLRKGDTAGEASILLDHPWPFTLKASRHVELIKVARPAIEDALARHPSLADSLWAAAIARLRARGASMDSPAIGEPVEFALTSGALHGQSVLLIDLLACTRCDDCVRACADAHRGQPRFVREGLKFRNFSVPTSCFHCLDPVCMSQCPTGAISRPYGTREVTVNEQTCVGCGNCSRLCPWGNIHGVPFESPTLGRQINLATKCDLCVGRADGPACVQMCPHGATIRLNFEAAEALAILAGDEAP